MKHTVLVVDDNEDIRAFVRISLEEDGYRVIEAVDGESALSIFRSESPDLILLDIGIGLPDGFEVCRIIRTESFVPIIMLTNRSHEVDEAMCLAAGADDYIRKPVSPRILTLRITNQIRRSKTADGKEATLLQAGELTLDVLSHELRVRDVIVPLTKTEFDFIELLMREPKRVFTRDQVISAIGASSDYSSDHLLDTHASRLRIKIKGAGGPKAIAAVRAVGYRLFDPDSSAPTE
jgi:two-component system response regulator ResD